MRALSMPVHPSYSPPPTPRVPTLPTLHPFYSPPQTPHPLIIDHLWMGPKIFSLLSRKLPMFLLWGWSWTNGFGWGKSISQDVWRGGPWNWDFFGPWNGNERRECHLGPKKSQFQGPPLQTSLVMDYSPIQIDTSRPHKHRYINSELMPKFVSNYNAAKTVYGHDVTVTLCMRWIELSNGHKNRRQSCKLFKDLSAVLANKSTDWKKNRNLLRNSQMVFLL